MVEIIRTPDFLTQSPMVLNNGADDPTVHVFVPLTIRTSGPPLAIAYWVLCLPGYHTVNSPEEEMGERK